MLVEAGGLLVRVATVLQFADGQVGASGDHVGLHFRRQLLSEPAADGAIVLLQHHTQAIPETYGRQGVSLSGKMATEFEGGAAVVGLHLCGERDIPHVPLPSNECIGQEKNR